MFGLPVVLDPSVPINGGGGTNQDSILILRASDSWLWESHIRAEMFPQTYAQNASLLARLYNYFALAPRASPSSPAPDLLRRPGDGVDMITEQCWQSFG